MQCVDLLAYIWLPGLLTRLVKLLLMALQVLATKMVAIMELSQQQLSKQDHYNYGLRSFIIPIARAAGEIDAPHTGAGCI